MSKTWGKVKQERNIGMANQKQIAHCSQHSDLSFVRPWRNSGGE